MKAPCRRPRGLGSKGTGWRQPSREGRSCRAVLGQLRTRQLLWGLRRCRRALHCGCDMGGRDRSVPAGSGNPPPQELARFSLAAHRVRKVDLETVSNCEMHPHEQLQLPTQNKHLQSRAPAFSKSCHQRKNLCSWIFSPRVGPMDLGLVAGAGSLVATGGTCGTRPRQLKPGNCSLCQTGKSQEENTKRGKASA